MSESSLSALYSRAQALDQSDPLAALRARFTLPPGVAYLDGNSLGALPTHVAERLRRAVEQEWGRGLIRSWNDAGWYAAPQRVAAAIARLIDAAADEVIVCDSTTVNLFKLLTAAMAAAPDRPVVIVEAGNFPTDAYVTTEAARLYGREVRLADQDSIDAAIEAAGTQLCVVALTHVHYKTGRMYDMARITDRVHAVGGRIVWDLAHSAGAVPVSLHACAADYAVGCGYKYLNGGPGAPAFAYVRRDLIAELVTPLVGWHGHAAPFAFEQAWRPHAGIARLLVGTAPQLSLLALESALEVFADVEIGEIRAKSISLTEFFIEGYDRHLASLGFGLVTPRDAASRGSQVSLTHPEGYAVMQALIERGVIGDFRAPDILRFGFAPLYVQHVDAAQAIATLAEVMHSGAWRAPHHAERKAVT